MAGFDVTAEVYRYDGGRAEQYVVPYMDVYLLNPKEPYIPIGR